MTSTISFSRFSYQPDVFLLLLPKSFEGVSIQPLVSSWGETDELLCTVEGTLIGQLYCDDRCPSTNVIQLLPKLDQKREYPFPSPQDFLQALVKTLRSSPQVTLMCERDADQEMVRQLATLDDVDAALRRVLAYCEGKRVKCPSFSYSLP